MLYFGLRYKLAWAAGWPRAARAIAAALLVSSAATLLPPIGADAEELAGLAGLGDDTMAMRIADKSGPAANIAAGLIDRATAGVGAVLRTGVAALLPARDSAKQWAALTRFRIDALKVLSAAITAAVLTDRTAHTRFQARLRDGVVAALLRPVALQCARWTAQSLPRVETEFIVIAARVSAVDRAACASNIVALVPTGVLRGYATDFGEEFAKPEAGRSQAGANERYKF
jgi:hypothetical protein